MKTTGTVLLFCCLLVACSSRKNEVKNEELTTISETVAKNKKTTTFQPMELTYPGSKIAFKVSVHDKQLII